MSIQRVPFQQVFAGAVKEYSRIKTVTDNLKASTIPPLSKVGFTSGLWGTARKLSRLIQEISLACEEEPSWTHEFVNRLGYLHAELLSARQVLTKLFFRQTPEGVFLPHQIGDLLGRNFTLKEISRVTRISAPLTEKSALRDAREMLREKRQPIDAKRALLIGHLRLAFQAIKDMDLNLLYSTEFAAEAMSLSSSEFTAFAEDSPAMQLGPPYPTEFASLATPSNALDDEVHALANFVKDLTNQEGSLQLQGKVDELVALAGTASSKK